MAIDFEAEGLLDGLDGESRDARLRLLEQLERDGVSLDELRDAVNEGRLALVPFGQLSTARLAHLMDPPVSDLPAFLATGAPGSSGLMIAEYVAADALARQGIGPIGMTASELIDAARRLWNDWLAGR